MQKVGSGVVAKLEAKQASFAVDTEIQPEMAMQLVVARCIHQCLASSSRAAARRGQVLHPSPNTKLTPLEAWAHWRDVANSSLLLGTLHNRLDQVRGCLLRESMDVTHSSSQSILHGF